MTDWQSAARVMAVWFLWFVEPICREQVKELLHRDAELLLAKAVIALGRSVYSKGSSPI
jgi:hypothetical protein